MSESRIMTRYRIVVGLGLIVACAMFLAVVIVSGVIAEALDGWWLLPAGALLYATAVAFSAAMMLTDPKTGPGRK